MTTETPDPLADLREPDAATLPGAPGQADDADDGALVEVRPMVTEETHASMVDEAVAALHLDLTAQGFLHGGGACGCRYIAAMVLTTVPVLPDDDGDQDLDDQVTAAITDPEKAPA